MKLAWVKVANYRQFVEEEILDVDRWLTIIAGANNSGKTSILELLYNVLYQKNSNFKCEDIPAVNVNSWLSEIQPVFEDVLLQKKLDADNFAERIKKRIMEEGKDFINESYLLHALDMKFCVEYENASENVQKFAEYYMDLDKNQFHFFFRYNFVLNEIKFWNELKNQYAKIRRRYNSICEAKKEGTDTRDRQESFRNMILHIYFRCLEEKAWYCNEDYSIQEKLEKEKIKALFNIRFIQASRRLDDVSNDKNFTLSKEIIEVLEKSEQWTGLMNELPDKVLGQIEKTDVKTTVHQQSIQELDQTVNELLMTNGGKEIKPDLQLDMTEEHIKELLGGVLAAKYKVDDYYLGESSQGLGLSNLIYIHLQIEKFIKEYDEQKVNIFFLEEPEAHMHPQMQQVFMKYLMDRKHEEAEHLQGIVTTHSAEMVGCAGFLPLRVIRTNESGTSRIVDLSSLEDVDKTYDLFFEIGYSEIVFADKVIFYEGDTERMYLRKLLQLKENKTLRKQYIAYIQVGGAYAYNYREILDLLKINALIITDIDYEKDVVEFADIEQSITTNSTIKNFYQDVYGNAVSNITGLYQMKKDLKNVMSDGQLYLAFQGIEDGCTRTLEEAMLCKKYRINVWDKKKKSEWKKLKDTDGLKFSLPQKYNVLKMENGKEKKVQKTYTDDSEMSVRDILRATSGSKTDFMFSVLAHGLEDEMQPDYIREGLKWLRDN